MTLPASPTGVFATHALELREAGFAVLPASGKKPMVSGWTEWGKAPTRKTVSFWAKRLPDANIAYVAGRSGLIVIDADDHDAADRALELFGQTPGQVRTRRGRHLLYRDNGASFPTTSNLHKLGINADIKHGGGFASIVIAPQA